MIRRFGKIQASPIRQVGWILYRIGFRERTAAGSRAKENSAALGPFSQLRPQTAIDVDVLRDHPARREAFGVAQTLLTPDRALRGIAQSKQVRREPGFVVHVVKKTGVAGCFG